MSISHEIKEYKNYGKVLFISNGKLTVGVTVHVGPRIIYTALEGRENIMFEDIERRFGEDVGEYGKWVNYGGHRLWSSPELVPDTYFPDNDPVAYEIDGNAFTFTAKPTPFGKEFSVKLEMDEDKAELKLTHKIKNVSDKTLDFAAWSLTCMTRGGVCIVPVCTRKSGFLPNRVLSLWDYSDIADPRFKLTNEYARIRQDSFCKGAFKAGFNVEDNFAAVAINNQLFIKKFEDYKFVNFPDYSCNVEVYTNDSFLECEVLSEKREYAPGECAVIEESWKLIENPDGYAPDIETLKELAK